MFVRGGCVLESFNPFGGLGCGLFYSVESICSMSTFGEFLDVVVFSLRPSSNDIPRIMHARTHVHTHGRNFIKFARTVRALFC
jgi:hypothetical protein